MRYPASEKLEIIRLVEQSHLPVRRTLTQIGIPRSTFYRWCDQYLTGGPEALDDRSPRPDRVWKCIRMTSAHGLHIGPRPVGALATELAVRFTDVERYFVSEGLGLSPAQGPRPDHQPGFYHDEGGGRVQEQYDCAEPALAD